MRPGEEILRENRSVVSHKTLEEMLEADNETSFRQKKSNQIRIHEAMESEDLKDAPVKPMPRNVKPMLATVVKEPFDHPDWIFEVKWDGYRAVAEIRETCVSLYSRNGISLAKKFSPVVDALRKFGSDAVLDGEIVVVDDQGRPDFQALQHYQGSGSGHLLYYVFDLLYFRGHDLTGLAPAQEEGTPEKDPPLFPEDKIQRSYIERRCLVLPGLQRKGTGRDRRQTFSKRIRNGQKEPAVA